MAQSIVFNKASVYHAQTQVTAINEISIHIEGGSFVSVVGPSGCGKTSLLRSVNAMVPLSSGFIAIDGQDISNEQPFQLRRKFGYVPQGGGMFAHMRVGQNLAVPLRLNGIPQEKWEERIIQSLLMVGLDESFSNRWMFELSGGQRQRVAFARALIHQPGCVLMDEPFGALDPLIRSEIHDELLNLRTKLDFTVLMVTHSMSEAIKLGDRVVVMKQGKIEQNGTADELKNSPKTEFISKLLATI